MLVEDKDNNLEDRALTKQFIRASFIIGDIQNFLSSPQLIISKKNELNSLTDTKLAFKLSLRVSNSFGDEEVVKNFATVELIN